MPLINGKYYEPGRLICSKNIVYVRNTESFIESGQEKFSIVLWAGTVGIGLKEDGSTKELHRPEEEMWNDFLVNTSKKEMSSEIPEPQMIPTVKVDGGPNPVIVSAIVVLISLIGFIATLGVFWTVLLVIETIVSIIILAKTLIDA